MLCLVHVVLTLVDLDLEPHTDTNEVLAALPLAWAMQIVSRPGLHLYWHVGNSM